MHESSQAAGVVVAPLVGKTCAAGVAEEVIAATVVSTVGGVAVTDGVGAGVTTAAVKAVVAAVAAIAIVVVVVADAFATPFTNASATGLASELSPQSVQSVPSAQRV